MRAVGELLKNRRVLVGVTGSIAAYKAAELSRALMRAGAVVRVVMTRAACNFVTPLTFSALTGWAAFTDKDFSDPPPDEPMVHISLARWAEVVVVAPATAEFISRLAMGRADQLLAAVALATTAPVLVAPAMNPTMYAHPAVQHNIKLISSRGTHLIIPGEGLAACGEEGTGRLAEIEEILEAVAAALAPKDLSGVDVLVTAGPTREHLDPVRFISNPSTGRMGLELARAAAARGANVVLVVGPTNLRPPTGVELVQVVSAREMYEQVMARAPHAHVIIKAAAVSDWRPEQTHPTKQKKHPGTEQLTLVPNPDILAELGRKKTSQVLVGFAAETEKLLNHAMAKLKAKNLDVIVANDVSAPGSGFAVATNRATIITRDGKVEQLPLMSKEALAHRVLDVVAGLLRDRR